MKICERCGKKFDLEGQWLDLDCPEDLYEKMPITLCANCANEAYNDEEDGLFFETCEKCGKEFDYFIDKSNFDMYNTDIGISLNDCWEKGILCSECALEEVDHLSHHEEDDFDDSADDNVDEESLSVYDAAEIWASHGKDEDYTYGYSEDELEDALH